MNWPNFAQMNGQQAPTSGPRQASRFSPVHTASKIANSRNGTTMR